MEVDEKKGQINLMKASSIKNIIDHYIKLNEKDRLMDNWGQL